MLTIVIYVVVTLIVAAALFALSVVVFGRGELLPPVPKGRTVTSLPDGPFTGEDVNSVRFSLAPRGYAMAEVDWTLDQAAAEIDRLRSLLQAQAQAPDVGTSHEVDFRDAPPSPDASTR